MFQPYRPYSRDESSNPRALLVMALLTLGMVVTAILASAPGPVVVEPTNPAPGGGGDGSSLVLPQ